MEVKDNTYKNLIYGLESRELALCLNKSRMGLIAAHEKAQNLPHNYKAGLNFVLKLGTKGLHVLIEGIQKNVLNEYDGEYSELVDELIVADSAKDKDTIKKTCRTILIGLANKSVSETVIERLNTFFDGDDKKRADEVELPKNLDNSTQLLCDVALGNISDKNDSDSSQSKFVEGLKYIRENDLQALENLLAKLDRSNIYYEPLSDSKNKLANKIRTTSQPKRGLIFDEYKDYVPEEIEIEDVIWVARCHKTTESQSFFTPIGYLKGSKLVIVPQYDLEQLLPEEGKAIVHSDRIGKLPKQNEVGCWYFEGFPTEKSIKIKAKSRVVGHDVYEVVEIPFKSNDMENIRYWLTNECPELVNKTIFLLDDGFLIKPRISISNPKNIDFNESFSLWHSLPAYKSSGKRYVISPLPKQDSAYNCEDIDSSLKKVIKQSLDQETLPKMSTAQVKGFINNLSQTSSFDTWQLERIEKYLSDSTNKINYIDGIISELLKLEVIQASLTLEKEKVIEEFKKGVAGHTKELEALIEEKRKAERVIKDTKEEFKTLSDSLSETIKATFLKAKDEGIATLAESALFQSLISNSRSLDQKNATDQIQSINVQRVQHSPSTLFRSLGLEKREARVLYTLIESAAKAGFIIFLKGFSSDYLSYAIASKLVEGTINTIEIPFGLSDTTSVQEALDNGFNNTDCFIIKTINRSPLNIVGTKLEASVMDGWLGEKHANAYCIVTVSDDDTCFTVPERYKFLGPIVNVDTIALENSGDNLLEDLSDLKSKINSNRIPKLWLEKIISLLQSAINSSPDDSVIISKFVRQFFIPDFVISQLDQVN